MFHYNSVLLIVPSFALVCAVQLAYYESDTVLNGKTCPAVDRVISMTTDSRMECAVTCQADVDCLSIFYAATNGSCDGCKRQPGYTDASLVTAGVATQGYVKDITTCQDVRITSITPTTGVHSNKYGVELYCDMDTDGGGWTVFLRRFDGSGDFKQRWIDYKTGFGNMHGGEFWFGLENLIGILHADNTSYQLRVDMEDFYGNTSFALYQNFNLGDESDQFRLHIGTFSGTAGDALVGHNGVPFSTWDDDNDWLFLISCSGNSYGGWWYHICFEALLTGDYNSGNDRMEWQTWSHNLKAAKMMIRETGQGAS